MTALTTYKTFDCGRCSAVFTSQRELDSHLCLIHDECSAPFLATPITFRCAICGEAFERRSALLAHMSRCGHGHPAEPGQVRTPGAPRPRGRSRRRSD